MNSRNIDKNKLVKIFWLIFIVTLPIILLGNIFILDQIKKTDGYKEKNVNNKELNLNYDTNLQFDVNKNQLEIIKLAPFQDAEENIRKPLSSSSGSGLSSGGGSSSKKNTENTMIDTSSEASTQAPIQPNKDDHSIDKEKDKGHNKDKNKNTQDTQLQSSGLVNTYIYGGSLLASKTNEDPTKTQYYIQDHLGSNRKVLDDNVLEEQNNDYTPFGEAQTTGDSENGYKYTGKEQDSETGLYYYGARYYDSEMGRFMSADVIRGSLENPLSLNRYSYVQNNPLKFIDPTGNKAKKPNKEDERYTKKFHRAVSHIYSKEISDTLQMVGVGIRNFVRDYPKADSFNLDAFWNGVDSIFVDSTALSQMSSDEAFSLIVGNEGGNAAISLGGTSTTTLENVFNKVEAEARNGDSNAFILLKYIIKTYVPVHGYNKKILGEEMISTINSGILQGQGNLMPQWMKDLSNMDKIKNNLDNIKKAKKEFEKN